MKRFLLFLGLLGVSILPMEADPITTYFPKAEYVCLAKITSIRKGMLTFSVRENLRGKVALELKLNGIGPGFDLGSEWLLVSRPMDFRNETVGWALQGQCYWIPAWVVRSGKTILIQTTYWYGSSGPLDTLPGGRQGLTLEHVKALLAKPPSKN